MLQSVLNFSVDALGITAGVAMSLATFWIVCRTGASAILDAIRDKPIQVRITHYSPELNVTVTTSDGKTLEAMAEFEDETEQQQ